VLGAPSFDQLTREHGLWSRSRECSLEEQSRERIEVEDKDVEEDRT